MKKTVSTLCAVAVMFACGAGAASADIITDKAHQEIDETVAGVKCESYLENLEKLGVTPTKETSFDQTVDSLLKAEKFQAFIDAKVEKANAKASKYGLSLSDNQAKDLKAYAANAYAKRGLDCKLLKGDKADAEKKLAKLRAKEDDEDAGILSIFTALSSSLSA